jgi:DNA-directed RNA polymerase
LDLKAISTLVSSIYLINPNSIGAVNVRKQITAFPPNFIHSLDASHMLKSAIACNQAGLTFASVHDSFWTHACDVDVMNVVLREAFVRMHSNDLIGQLRDEFTERYKGHYVFEDKIKIDADTVDASDLDVYEGPNGQVITRRRSGTAWKPIEFPPIPAKVHPPLSQH